MGSLLFGGGHMPVLNGDSRANRENRAAPNSPDLGAAGALRPQQTRSMCAAELSGDRRMKAPQRHVHDLYDDYLDASEKHAFDKLHATMGKLERKAEKEHKMYSGAAGWSSEHRNDLADARASPGGRRARSPARFNGREQARMDLDSGSSVGSLLQQGNYNFGLQQQGRSGGETDRSGGETDRSAWGAPYAADRRAPSPRGRAPSPRGQRAPSPQRTRPASPRPSSAGRGGPPPSQRASSPFRQRPEH